MTVFVLIRANPNLCARHSAPFFPRNLYVISLYRNSTQRARQIKFKRQQLQKRPQKHIPGNTGQTVQIKQLRCIIILT